MAEFCRDCFIRYVGGTEAELRRAVISEEPELCEGCGRLLPIVVRIRPTAGQRLKLFLLRLLDPEHYQDRM